MLRLTETANLTLVISLCRGLKTFKTRKWLKRRGLAADDSECIKLGFFQITLSRGTVMRILIPTLLVRTVTLKFYLQKGMWSSETT